MFKLKLTFKSLKIIVSEICLKVIFQNGSIQDQATELKGT